MRTCDVSVPASNPFSSCLNTGGAIPRNADHTFARAGTSGDTGGVFAMLLGLKMGGSDRGGSNGGFGALGDSAIGEPAFFCGAGAGFLGGDGLGAGPATSPVGTQRSDTPRGSGNLNAGGGGSSAFT